MDVYCSAMISRCRMHYIWPVSYTHLPYIVPLHYGYEYTEGILIFYMHCAKEGHKLDLIRSNPNVCIEVAVSYTHLWTQWGFWKNKKRGGNLKRKLILLVVTIIFLVGFGVILHSPPSMIDAVTGATPDVYKRQGMHIGIIIHYRHRLRR